MAASATAAATNRHSTSVGPNAGSRWWPRSWLIRIKPSNQEAISGDHRPSHGRRVEISLGGSVGHPVGLIAGGQRHRVLGHLQTPPAVFARRTSIKLGPRQRRRSLQPATDTTVTDPKRSRAPMQRPPAAPQPRRRTLNSRSRHNAVLTLPKYNSHFADCG